MEELEDRFGECMEAILSHVRSAFTQPHTTTIANRGLDTTFRENHVKQWSPCVEGDEEVIFDDMGKSAASRESWI